MMCYKDKSFCPFWEDCSRGDICPDVLTDKVRQYAKQLELPISQFAEKPECFIDKQKNI